jgi:hypothetical protein
MHPNDSSAPQSADAIPSWNNFGPMSKQLVLHTLNESVGKTSERIQVITMALTIAQKEGFEGAVEVFQVELAVQTSKMTALQSAMLVLNEQTPAAEPVDDHRGERYFIAIQKLVNDLDAGLENPGKTASKRLRDIMLSIEGLHG